MAVVQYQTSSQYSVVVGVERSRSGPGSPSGRTTRAFDGASPNHSATWALAYGEMIQSIHSTCSWGSPPATEIIHVSDQPVAPSTGLTASILAPLAWAG